MARACLCQHRGNKYCNYGCFNLKGKWKVAKLHICQPIWCNFAAHSWLRSTTPPCSVPSARDSIVYISPFTHDNSWGGEGAADHKKQIVLLVPTYGSGFQAWGWVLLKALESLCSSHYMASCLTMRLNWFEITQYMISHHRKPFDHKTAVWVTDWAITSGQHLFPSN